jgi:hypothetical protein
MVKMENQCLPKYFRHNGNRAVANPSNITRASGGALDRGTRKKNKSTGLGNPESAWGGELDLFFTTVYQLYPATPVEPFIPT